MNNQLVRLLTKSPTPEEANENSIRKAVGKQDYQSNLQGTKKAVKKGTIIFLCGKF